MTTNPYAEAVEAAARAIGSRASCEHEREPDPFLAEIRAAVDAADRDAPQRCGHSSEPMCCPFENFPTLAAWFRQATADAPAQAPEPSGDVVERAARVLAEYHHLGPEQWRGDARALADAGLLADPEVRMLDAVARVTPCTCSAQRQRAEKAETERDNARNRADLIAESRKRWEGLYVDAVRERDEARLLGEKFISAHADVKSERDRARDLAVALEQAVARLTEELDAWRSGRRRRAWPSHPAVPDAIGTAAMLARAQTGEDERLDSILREGAATITALRDGYGVAAAERDEARARAAELEADNARLTEERDERQRSADWAWRCANGYAERAEAAEARARRAEDALRALRKRTMHAGELELIDRALSGADQASDTTTKED